jgi:hypothetical protein
MVPSGASGLSARSRQRLLLVLLSDGETTPADYAAAKARLLNAELLEGLAAYQDLHVLLIGIGASRCVRV